MNLAVFFYRNGSFSDLKAVGQDMRFIKNYLEPYSRQFDRIYIFSYANESRNDIPKNCIIVPNKHRIPAALYSFMIPILHPGKLKKCDTARVFHISGTPSAVISRLLFGLPYVTTYAYLWINDLKFRKMYYQLPTALVIESLGARLADGVIITFGVTKKYVRRYTNKIHYIPNSIDIDVFRPLNMKKGNRKRIIFIGRLNEIKNLDSLIRAVSMISPKPELVFFSNRNALKKQYMGLAEELGVDLKINDVIPNERLPEELCKSDVFVLTSFFEGHPKALLEAMSCAMPCVGTNVRGIRDIIRDNENGVLCGTSPKEISEAIQSLLENPEKAKRLGENARKYITENLSSRILIEREIALLKSVAKKRI